MQNGNVITFHGIAINAMFSYIGMITNMALRFFLLPFSLNKLGVDGYAVVALAISIENLVNLMRVGTSAATTKHISGTVGKMGSEKISEFMSTALIHGLATGLIGLIICLFLAASPENLTNMSPLLQGHLSNSVAIVGIGTLLCFWFMPFEGFLCAHQRYDLVYGCRLGFGIFSGVCVVIAFVYWKASPEVYVGISTLSIILLNIIYIILAFKVHKGLKIRAFYAKKWALKLIVGFSVWVLIGTLLGNIYLEGVKWAIVNRLGTVALTNYVIIMMVYSQMNLLIMTGMRVLIPVVSNMQANNESHVLRKILCQGTKTATILTLILLAVLSPVMGPILTLWLGRDYAWLAPHVSAVLLCGVVSLPSICGGQVLVGLGKVKLVAILQGISFLFAFISLAFGFFVLNLGFASATLAICISCIVRGVCNHVAAMVATNQGFRHYIWDATLKPIFISTPMIILIYIIANTTVLDTIVKLIVFIVLSLCAFMVFTLISLSVDEKRHVNEVYIKFIEKIGIRKEIA